jgi:hypothetical protein
MPITEKPTVNTSQSRMPMPISATPLAASATASPRNTGPRNRSGARRSLTARHAVQPAAATTSDR